METNLLTFFGTLSWAGVAGLFVWFVLKPLIGLLIEKLSGGNGLVDRMNTLENNHLHEVNRRLNCLDAADIRIQDDLGNIRDRLSKIEGRMNGRLK